MQKSVINIANTLSADTTIKEIKFSFRDYRLKKTGYEFSIKDRVVLTLEPRNTTDSYQWFVYGEFLPNNSQHFTTLAQILKAIILIKAKI